MAFRPEQRILRILWLKCPTHNIVIKASTKGTQYGLIGTQYGWWFGAWLLFFHILGVIIPIPTDFHSNIFQRGRYTYHQPVYSLAK